MVGRRNRDGGREENVLYRNDGASGHWLGVRLIGTRSDRSGIGARVMIHPTTGEERVLQIREHAGAST